MSTIKKNFIWLLFVFALILFVVKFFPSKQNKSSQLFYETIQTDGGWGYDIYRNDSIYIHQITIPALEGTRHFKSESDAKKVASLVMEKMRYHQFPGISLKDLDSLKIK